MGLMIGVGIVIIASAIAFPRRENNLDWLRRWAVEREVGFWVFMLRKGILGFGAPLGLTLLVIKDLEGELAGVDRPAINAAIQALVTGILYGTLAWLGGEQRYRRLRGRAGGGRCLKCDYDLRGSSERCPECGTVFASGEPTEERA